jgi:hypothetical protein
MLLWTLSSRSHDERLRHSSRRRGLLLRREEQIGLCQQQQPAAAAAAAAAVAAPIRACCHRQQPLRCTCRQLVCCKGSLEQFDQRQYQQLLQYRKG